MAFTSYNFLFFFFVVFILYWAVRERRWQNLLLLTSSLIFYGWIVPWHAAVLLTSTLVDYFLALGMAGWKSKSTVLMWIGILLNVSLVAFVKNYFRYDEVLAAWATQAGLDGSIFFISTILPMGVSFYTLKKISYLVEVQRGIMMPFRDLAAFGAYVSFFPQVFSGPIDRPQSFLKQLEQPRIWEAGNFYNAWQLILMGLFKKIVIANTVKVIVDQIFLIKEPSKVFLVVGGLGFTLQILTDFSSYTDLSRGVAFLLGLKTTENFNRPYLALTPNDFWNRWHISLSSWLRDYIFFPIRRSLLRMKGLPDFVSQLLPPWITMFISGLWHGTGLTFIVWGLYHGLLIVIYQLLGIRGDQKSFKRFFAWIVMFGFIVIGWIIFRAPSIVWLWHALTAAPFSHSADELIASLVLSVMIFFYASLLYIKHLLDHYAPERVSLHAIYYTAAALMTLIFVNSSSPDFIYFQF